MITLETIEYHIIDNNQYQIFSIEQADAAYKVQLIWGKLDFEVILQEKESQWETLSFQVNRNSCWYQYSKITAQQILFQEIQWQNKDDIIYLELPKSFAKNSKAACIKGIKNKYKI